LSVDQTGGNPDEAARIRAEHPDEEKAVSKGRVLGTLEPSRSFGDGIYKWKVETQLKLQKSFFARSQT
jgi:pyruvate dehydrogenase phosphatase